MSLANNIKHLSENKGPKQKQETIEIGLGISHYDKIENEQREASVELLDKLDKLYDVYIDAIVYMEGEVPKEIVMEDKTTSEQMRLIQELDEKDKSIIFSMIDIMLTKKKLRIFSRKTLLHYKAKSPALPGFLLFHFKSFQRVLSFPLEHYHIQYLPFLF